MVLGLLPDTMLYRLDIELSLERDEVVGLSEGKEGKDIFPMTQRPQI